MRTSKNVRRIDKEEILATISMLCFFMSIKFGNIFANGRVNQKYL